MLWGQYLDVLLRLAAFPAARILRQSDCGNNARNAVPLLQPPVIPQSWGMRKSRTEGHPRTPGRRTPPAPLLTQTGGRVTHCAWPPEAVAGFRLLAFAGMTTGVWFARGTDRGVKRGEAPLRHLPGPSEGQVFDEGSSQHRARRMPAVSRWEKTFDFPSKPMVYSPIAGCSAAASAHGLGP